MYDKNIYENYPSYLMGKKKENDNKTEEFNNCRIREYDFDNYGGGSLTGHLKNLLSGLKSGPVEGMGIKMSLQIDGKTQIIRDNILKISIDVLSRPDLEITAYVELIQNETTLQNSKFNYPRDGYIHEPYILPLGDAFIKLPYHGKYEVIVHIGCVYTGDSGRGANSYSFNLPYSK